MPISELTNIIGSCPKNKRLLGMDLGTRTIGLAISDEQHRIATPLKTIRRKKLSSDMEELSEHIDAFDVGGFILGYPLNMDGSKGPRCDATMSFAMEFKNYPQIVGTDPWIALWDERLSTQSVEEFLVESVDMSRTKRKQVIDKLAAQHILQGALDFMALCQG